MIRIRRLSLLALTFAPLAALVACSASNGDAIAELPREAGSLEAGRSSRDADAPAEEDGSSSIRDGGKGDASKDARGDVDAGLPVVRISEIYVDIDGFGDGAELVELRAAPGSPVHDLKLRILGLNGAVDYEVDVGGQGDQVGATGFWVVGGAQTFKLGVTDRVDHIVSLANWGLETSRGAVQLVRGTELLDVVAWSDDPDAGAIPAPPSPPTSTGEGSPAGVPTITKTSGNPAHSFGRGPAAADTNDNRADFCSMAASPGFEQKPCD